jgi:uncharacterized protein (TIGR04255 family)
MQELPKRISPDAILESIIELRFSSGELPEVFLGRLLTSEVFRGLSPTRLPQADIPFSAREADENLRFQPIYQLEAGNELVRLGTGSISLHYLPPYPGWSALFGRAESIVRGAWASAGQPPLQRCGLRYVNALTSEGHGIRSIEDLNLAVRVAGQQLVDVTVNFLTDDASHTETLIRIASARHVKGDLPSNATFAVDIDTRTTGDISTWDPSDVLSWLSEARAVKNKHFFELLPDRIIETLQVD